MRRLSLVLVLSLLAVGCENVGTRKFGGTTTIHLPAGQKLQTATWKENDLWYLTRPMRAGETPETSRMTEKSSLGLAEGTVVFIESAATAKE